MLWQPRKHGCTLFTLISRCALSCNYIKQNVTASSPMVNVIWVHRCFEGYSVCHKTNNESYVIHHRQHHI